MITVTSLTKRFGDFAAVDNLTFQVASQEAVALWGPNGAGKTTVIKCLLGLLRYEGQILVGGRDGRCEGKGVRHLVGYVPQELTLYSEMTALQTARLFARLKKSAIEQADAVLAQVGLLEHAGKPVGALSGGMKQRLALGLALLGDPSVLVLDEPTSNLDTEARAHLLELLGAVKAAGKTILFTSHRLDEIETLADKVLVMDRGKLNQTCRAHELAEALVLRTHIKLRLADGALDTAVVVLNERGYNARLNGRGIIVEVPPHQKAAPIGVLGAADITVVDFDLE